MNIVRHPGAAPAETLLVLLPGAYMTPEHFVEAGFLEALDARRLALDLAIAGLNLENITDGSALPLVRDKILQPARARYRRVWLGGISLGGFLALLCAARHANDVDGLCLFAPYPGSRITTNAIAAAGGLAAWQASAAQLADPEFELWDWLRRVPVSLSVHIDYGDSDRFAPGMAQLAAAIPHAMLRTRPGGHDWPVWRAAWEAFLDTGAILRDGVCS